MTETPQKRAPFGAKAYERNYHGGGDSTSFKRQMEWLDGVDAIREKKKAEEEARASNIFYRALLHLFKKK